MVSAAAVAVTIFYATGNLKVCFRDLLTDRFGGSSLLRKKFLYLYCFVLEAVDCFDMQFVFFLCLFLTTDVGQQLP